MGGSQTSPVRPFVKSNAKMKNMEHWCNDTPVKAVVQFVFGKKRPNNKCFTENNGRSL